MICTLALLVAMQLFWVVQTFPQISFPFWLAFYFARPQPLMKVDALGLCPHTFQPIQLCSTHYVTYKKDNSLA